MRFYNQQHRFYCGVDLHARIRSLCILDDNGTIVLQKTIAAGPDAFLQAVAPFRDGLAVAWECMFAWYGLADLCEQEKIPFVLGHALYMKAIHGGKAKTDKIDAHQIAVLLRGGMLPQAYVYPKGMRETRDQQNQFRIEVLNVRRWRALATLRPCAIRTFPQRSKHAIPKLSSVAGCLRPCPGLYRHPPESGSRRPERKGRGNADVSPSAARGQASRHGYFGPVPESHRAAPEGHRHCSDASHG